MRLFMDMLIALLLTSMLAGAMWQTRADTTAKQQRDHTRLEVRRFQQQIALQSALSQVVNSERGYPETVDPDWFQGNLPANALLSPNHPWLEIAGPAQAGLIHPVDCVAGSTLIAKFWYNPYLGIVRARVPSGISDASALQLYNYVNDCELPELFAYVKD